MPATPEICYAAISVNSVAAILTLFCVFFEHRFSRNRWYLWTNAVAFLLNVGSVLQWAVIFQRPELGMYFTNVNTVVAQVLILLLIKQNSTILDCFSFLNSSACSRVLKYSVRYLYVQMVVDPLSCFVRVFYYFYNPGSYVHYEVANLIYNINSCLNGVFLITQTLLQNAWITKKVYNVSSKIGAGPNENTLQQLIMILGGCFLVDWYRMLTSTIFTVFVFGTIVDSIVYLNPYIYALFGLHTAILTLSQQKLRLVIKPAVNRNYVLSHNLLSSTKPPTTMTSVSATLLSEDKKVSEGDLQKRTIVKTQEDK